MKIIITSHNPVKRNATERAFKLIFPETTIEIQELSAPSGVSAQPMSDEETLKGAKQRVENASKTENDTDYIVGIEGGIELNGDEMGAFAWIYMTDKNGKASKAKSSTFILPHKLSELVRSGMELGDADDIVFGQKNSKQKDGTVGALTKGLIDRTAFYEHAVILALIPYINPDLY